MFPLWEIFFAFIGIFFKTLLLTIQVGLLLPRKCLRAACHPYPNLTRQISSCTSRPAARDCCNSASFLACSAARRLAWNACNLKGPVSWFQPMFSDGCLEILNPRWKTVPTKMACYRKLWWTLIPWILTLHQWKKLVSCWRSHKSWDKPCLLALPHTPHAQQKKPSWSSPQPSKWFYKIWCWIAKPGYSSPPFQHLISSGRILGYPRAWCGHITTIQFRNCSSNCLFSLGQSAMILLTLTKTIPLFTALFHQWLNHSLNLAGEEGSLQISNMTDEGCKIWLEGHSQKFGPRYSASLRCARFGRWAIVPGVNM